MNKKWIDMPELPVFYDKYIKKVDYLTLNAAFNKHSPSAIMSDIKRLLALGNQVYAENKWTINDILQHIIDTERVMSYRALRFARNDKTEVPGFPENIFAQNTNANKRTFEDLMEEWEIVRSSSIAMFKSFDTASFDRTGMASGVEISVLALAFVILGHPMHHYQIIEERYFPLLEN